MTTSDPTPDPTNPAADPSILPETIHSDLSVPTPSELTHFTEDPIILPHTHPDLRVAIPPEATEEILAVLRRHGVEGYLSSISISRVPNPAQLARQKITYYYLVENVCTPFTKRQDLPHCRL
jgi:hypothetical protein